MGNTTIYKWPTPDPRTAALTDIGTLVTNLAQAIENSFIVPLDSKAQADPYDSWPIGLSLMHLTLTGANNGGWVQPGLVLTLHPNTGGTSGRTAQLLVWGSATAGANLMLRYGQSTGWSSWIPVAGPSSPSAQATGQITLTPPSGGGTVVGTVLFPTNRFATAPRVQLTPVTTVPANVHVSINAAPTNTRVTVALTRTDGATGTSIQWSAVLGPE